MRRFELVEGSSSKFWEIEVGGTSYTVRFGRIGTSGQTQTKDLGHAAAAQAAADKLIKEKTKKGYEEVGAGAPRDESAPKTPPTPAPKPAAKPGKQAPAPSPAAAASPPPPVETANSATASPVAGEMPAALRRMALATRANPDGNADTPKSLLEEHAAAHGLVSALDEILAGPASDPRSLARAIARADDDAWNAARDYAEARLHEHEAQWATNANVSPNLCGALALMFFTDDRALVEGLFARALEVPPYARRFLTMLLPFVTDEKLWDRAAKKLADWELDNVVDPATALVHQGPEALGLIERVYSKGTNALRERIFSVVDLLKTDAAAEFLIEHAEDRLAAEPFARLIDRDRPRAFRTALTIATRTTRPTLARDLVEMLIRRDAGLASLATTDAQRALVQSLVGDNTASLAPSLPPLLAKAPWLGRKVAPPSVVPGLVPPDEPVRLVWPEGMREKFLTLPKYWEHLTMAQMAEQAAQSMGLRGANAEPSRALAHLSEGMRLRWTLDYGSELLPYLPEPTRTAVWENVHPTAWRMKDRDAKALVAALEGGAVDGLLIRAGVLAAPEKKWLGEARRAAALPQSMEALLPVASPRIGLLAALGFGHRRARKAAAAWVLANPDAAARGLVPIAVGKPGKERTGAEEGLGLLASQGHRDAVLSAASAHGPECANAVTAVLEVDPLAVSKAPKLPSWLDVTTLAPLLLRDGARVPDDARAIVVGMLVASAADAPYPGIETIKEQLDEGSLDAFAWSLFRAWSFAGAPSKDGWAFTALAHIGGERCVSRLAPLVARWPNDGLAARAQTGVEILGTIGTDTALVALHRFAQKAKTKGLKAAAQEMMDAIAEARGLTADELADRLVPDLGLDDGGTLELDLGDRVLTVGFDEILTPFVREPDGSRSASFPKPDKNADKARHKEAKARFAQLQKDAKEVSRHVLARLENAMANGRGWPADVAEACFFTHPLMRHLAARVAWIARDDDGRDLGAFRVAEDGSLATPGDDPFELPPKATAVLLHPARARAEDLAKLAEVFADYEILQPFPQLSRPVLRLEPGERGSELRRWAGRKVPTKRMFSLESRGWTRTVIGQSSKVVGDGRATLRYSPGIDGSPDAWQGDEQTLDVLHLAGTKLEALDPVIVSELLYDVERLFDS